MLGEHLFVLDEATCGENHAPVGADQLLLLVDLGHDSYHPAILGGHECQAECVCDGPGAGLVHAGDDLLHDQAAGVSLRLRLVAPGRGLRVLAEGECGLVPGVDQAVVRLLDRRLVRVEGSLELEPQSDEPLEVLDALLAVEPYLLLVGSPARLHQVLEHLLRGVVEAARLLDGSPAAEVDQTTGVRRRSPAGCGPLQDQDVGARPRRLDGRRAPRGAEPHHHDVRFHVPLRDLPERPRFGGQGSALVGFGCLVCHGRLRPPPAGFRDGSPGTGRSQR